MSPLAEEWISQQKYLPGSREFEVTSPSSHEPFVVVEVSSWWQVPYLMNKALQPELQVAVSFPDLNNEGICAEQRAIQAFLVSYWDSSLKESLPILEQRISQSSSFERVRVGGVSSNAGQWIEAFGLKPVLAYPKIALPPEGDLEVSASTSDALLPVYQPSLPWSGDKKHCLPRTLPSKTIYQSLTDHLPVLGTGGEGKVIQATDQTAYKLYHELRVPAAQLPGKNVAAKPRGAAETVEELTDRAMRLPAWTHYHITLPLSFVSYPTQPNHVAGFEMRLIENAVPFEKYRSPSYIKANKISTEQIAGKFVELYDLLWELQQARIVVGDLKFDNVLVSSDGDLCLIDVDGFGVEGHPCKTFSRGYVDPRLCDPSKPLEMLVKQQDCEAMWYSYTVMLFEALVGAHPFREGIHEPTDGSDEIPDESRALRGVWAFHRDVITPEETVEAFNKLPKEPQSLFRQVFDGGKRGRPRRDIIAKLCGSKDSHRHGYAPHTRPPWLLGKPPSARPLQSVEDVQAIPGQGSPVLSAAMIDGAPKVFTAQQYEGFRTSIIKQFGWSASVKGFLDRGKGLVVCEGQYDDNKRTLDANESWIWAKAGEEVYGLAVGRSPFHLPNIRVQGDRVVFINRAGNVNSVLGTKDGRSLGEIKGDVSLLSGPDFGIICRTENGNLSDIFLLSDRLTRLDGIPPVLGTISGLEASFSKKFCWLFIAAEPEGKPVGYTLVFNKQGRLVGFQAQDISNPKEWVGSRTTCAYEIASSGDAPGLAGIGPSGEIQRITCDKFAIKPYRATSPGARGVPWMLLADEGGLFGVW